MENVLGALAVLGLLAGACVWVSWALRAARAARDEGAAARQAADAAGRELAALAVRLETADLRLDGLETKNGQLAERLRVECDAAALAQQTAARELEQTREAAAGLRQQLEGGRAELEGRLRELETQRQTLEQLKGDAARQTAEGLQCCRSSWMMAL
jgi:hypothetical protein